MNKAAATTSVSSEAATFEDTSSEGPSTATHSSHATSSEQLSSTAPDPVPIEFTQHQQHAMSPNSDLQRTRTPPVVMVDYLHCFQCSKSTMLLDKPESDECDYCGHSQFTNCDEWVNWVDFILA
jgi:DNA-directed RNA polymerase subunit RPC12/RpoP